MNEFPKYLDYYPEDPSYGPVIEWLKRLLRLLGYLQGDPGKWYELDTAAVEAVKKLQAAAKLEPDGNFGPNTRRALELKHGIDFDRIPELLNQGVTVFNTPTERGLVYRS